MEVILLERVEKLGQMGQVVNVRPGFARNYLLPQKKALRASKANLELFEKQQAHLEAANQERRKEAEVLAGTVDGAKAVIIRQAGDSGVLYGSVTGRDVAEALVAAGHKVDRKQVAIDTPIKTLGLFPVRVILHPEVAVSVVVNVARSVEEAELQAERGAMVTAADLLEEEEVEVEAEVSTEESSEEA